SGLSAPITRYFPSMSSNRRFLTTSSGSAFPPTTAFVSCQVPTSCFATSGSRAAPARTATIARKVANPTQRILISFSPWWLLLAPEFQHRLAARDRQRAVLLVVDLRGERDPERVVDRGQEIVRGDRPLGGVGGVFIGGADHLSRADAAAGH